MKEIGPFERGVALFNEGEFFQAHEVWEELWLAEPEPEKTFLQALIQVAAAFHHHGRGNSRGRGSLLAAGIAKLERFPGNYHGLALGELRAEAKQWTGVLGEGTQAEGRELPQIRLIDARSARPGTDRVRGKKKRGG